VLVLLLVLVLILLHSLFPSLLLLCADAAGTDE
jgi:hypothetical protein